MSECTNPDEQYCPAHHSLRGLPGAGCDAAQIACERERAEAAEAERDALRATVERVRALCEDEFNSSQRMMNPGRLGYRRALRNVLALLDGTDD